VTQDHDVELRGERVLLRRVRAADLDTLVQIFEHELVAQWWHGFDRGRVERELLSGSGDEDETILAIDVDGEVVGVIQCYEESDPDYRSAALDIAVAPARWGTGVAVDAVRTLARALVERRGHHHLTIDPAVDNHRAIACYAKVGFQPVGTLRQNERGPDGTYRDALLMDLVADELT
jgi:aminoglycoside 6'-N-acetyltransferase